MRSTYRHQSPKRTASTFRTSAEHSTKSRQQAHKAEDGFTAEHRYNVREGWGDQ